jgi:hypothetical protein
MSRPPAEAVQPDGDGTLWYARRDGVVRGPFGRETVSRHLLLGRIRIDDELSTDRRDWIHAGQVPGMIPSVMTRLTGLSDSRAFHAARLRADERAGERRGGSCSGCGKCRAVERRVLPDRRKTPAYGAGGQPRERPRVERQALPGRLRYLVFALATALLLVLVVPASH